MQNGTWPDVNYTGNDRVIWEPMLHLERTFAMARAYHCAACSHQYQNASILADTKRALQWWLDKQLPASQWWWADIGEPDYVMGILILLNDSVTQDEIQQALPILNKAGNGTSGVGESSVANLPQEAFAVRMPWYIVCVLYIAVHDRVPNVSGQIYVNSACT